MPIDPRALRTYLAVCRAGSITGAAQALNISQPAISVTISQLEAALSTTLFERTRAGVILSPAGIALKRRAEALESLLKSAEEEVAMADKAIAGPFRIGGTPGALASLVPRLVSSMRERGLKFSMHVVEQTDAELTDMLRKGELDAAMVTTGIEALAEDLEERTLTSDVFSLIVGRKNDRLPASIELRDTTELQWVMPEAAGAFRRQIRALFLATDASVPSEVVRCDSLLATLAIVRTTDYVTILPHGVASAEIEAGSLRAVQITGAPFQRKIGIRTMKDGKKDPTVRSLLDCLDVS